MRGSGLQHLAVGSGQRPAAQGLSAVCSGGGSVVMALVAFAVEFSTSPKSPPAGLAPPTLDFLESVKQKRHHETTLTVSVERNFKFTFKNVWGLSWPSVLRVDVRTTVLRAAGLHSAQGSSPPQCSGQRALPRCFLHCWNACPAPHHRHQLSALHQKISSRTIIPKRLLTSVDN